MRMTALSILLTFSLTINRFGTNAVLRYPVATGVTWVEVCTEIEGVDPKSSDRWFINSCWTPRFAVEEVKLPPGSLSIRAVLEITEDSHHSFLRTPKQQVRPEPET